MGAYPPLLLTAELEPDEGLTIRCACGCDSIAEEVTEATLDECSYELLLWHLVFYEQKWSLRQMIRVPDNPFRVWRTDSTGPH
jgi:hypothetical protein